LDFAADECPAHIGRLAANVGLDIVDLRNACQ
jgi:hypothetical protein